MARQGLSFESVNQAAITLLSQGIAPSVQKVRDILQTGSNSTIAAHLRTWREEFQNKAVATLPATIPEKLMPALETFWQIAMTQAEQQLLAQKKQVDEQQANFEQEQQKLSALHVDMKQRLTDFQKKMLASNQENQGLKKELLLAKTSLADQKASTEEKLQWITDRLNRAYAEKDTALERVELVLEKKSALQHKMQQQVDAHNKSLITERERQEAAEARWLVMIDEGKSENKRLQSLLKQEQAQHYTNNRAHQEKSLELNTELAEHRTQLKLGEQKSADYSSQIKEINAENQNLKARILYLEAKIDEIQRKVKKKSEQKNKSATRQ